MSRTRSVAIISNSGAARAMDDRRPSAKAFTISSYKANAILKATDPFRVITFDRTY